MIIHTKLTYIYITENILHVYIYIIYIFYFFYIHFFYREPHRFPQNLSVRPLEATIRPGEMLSPKFTAETAQFRSQNSVSWSTEIPITEDVAGPAAGHGHPWAMGKDG